MAEQSGFFNSNVVNGEYDRVYLAEHFAKYFSSFIGNGIFGGKSSELMVSYASEMRIEILPGMAWINGFWYENTSNLSLDIDVADGVLDRIDNVVIKYGIAERKIWAEVVKGTPSSSPVAPPVKRNADYYELKIAEIPVLAGTTHLTPSSVRDTRYDNEVCGFVIALIQQFDTTEFGRQLDAYITEYASSYAAYLEELEINGSASINSLIAKLNALAYDNNILANLTLEVDDVANEAALVSQTLGYAKKNLIQYPYKDTTKTITGITWNDNGDGTVSANGTANEDTYFQLYQGKMLRPGKYLITSGIDDSAKAYYAYVSFINKSNGSAVVKTFRGFENTPFEVTESDASYDIVVSIVVGKGKSVPNVTFKPMLRRAEIIDNTWEPYRLSVAEMIQEDEIEKGCFYRIDRFTGIKTWINPPNKPGVEYCTTEMWNDKPVYQKTFYVSTLPNTSIASISTNTEWDKVILVNAYALDSDDLTYYPFPVILQNQVTPIAVINKVESDGSLVITTIADASHLEAYVTVKYIKS